MFYLTLNHNYVVGLQHSLTSSGECPTTMVTTEYSHFVSFIYLPLLQLQLQ